jgi:hypothetical protein
VDDKNRTLLAEAVTSGKHNFVLVKDTELGQLINQHLLNF